MKSTFSLILVGLGLVAAMFISAKKTSSEPGYVIGDEVQHFTLKGIDGSMISLKDFSDSKGCIIVFTCNTCPYAKMYEQRIVELHDKYSNKGYPVVAINPNCKIKKPGDSFEAMKTLAQDKKYRFAYLRDENQNVAKAFGATKTPHVYVTQNQGGTFRVRYMGAIDNNHVDASQADLKYVENAVDALLEGKEVETTTVKAIGCTIKWKDI